MAEMTKCSMEHELGCGLMGGIFQLRSYWPGKKSVPSLSSDGTSNDNLKLPVLHNSKKPPTHDSNIRRSTSADSSLVDSILAKPSQKPDKKQSRRPSLVPPKSTTSQQEGHSRRPSDAVRSTSSSSSPSKPKATKFQDLTDTRKLSNDPPCTSTELSTVVFSNCRQSGANNALARATSSNIMLIGQLGNLKQLGTGSLLGNNSPNATIKTADYLYRNLQEGNSKSKHRYGQSRLGDNGVMGNIVKQPSGEFPKVKGLTNKLDPEVLKSMGNDAYKKGRFADALALYDSAIALNSNNATYRSNRSAALIGLGRLMEALVECKEAIRIDPSYCRAQHRLATIYLRLGEAEKALYHYKQSGSLVGREDIAKAEALHNHLIRCNEARKLKEWSDLLKGTQFGKSVGADSAPHVYALQTEALLRLQRHQEAFATYKKGPKFFIEPCTKLFGPAGSAYILVMKAQVYMATGRLEDAVKVALHAAQLDPNNQEIASVVKRAKVIASARLRGNLLFKASKYLEACNRYNEGLEYEPYNSILLCNRAACRSKLGQYEKAVEDCTTALILQPSYSKARLRRADCNAKLERWEASIQDYEILIRKIPGDEEVGRALFEAQVQLKRQRGEDVKDMKFGSNLIQISSNERFRHFVTLPGMAVVLFCNKANHKPELQLMEQVCRRFPSVNFLKVEVEDHPYLAKSEGVSSVPAFKIYKNGSRVKEIPGNSLELLEKSVKLYGS
ncbi:TPR repeat-containing thioredoxin TTL1-like [Mangifera indica]|uniref:TPR repeat-containing thioredoxin TTL1-like n=1 Tax=Mangifera indica TaxID=29780 RepID=UPI001CFA15E3|nr:TPR repeat-containing thioredoxin TTL1-like [Mangifera indica]